MADEILEAVVASQRARGERDALVCLLTARGRCWAIARGQRRSRPRFGSALDPFTRVELRWQRRTSSSLPWLKEVRVLERHHGLRRDFARVAVASYAIEATGYACPEGMDASAPFGLLKETLALFADARREELSALWLRFLLRLLTHMGLGPVLGSCVECGRPAPPTRPVLVYPGEGGVLCSSCRRDDGSDALLLSASSRSLLRELSAETMAPPEGAAPDAAFGELRRVLETCLVNALERPLETSALLPF